MAKVRCPIAAGAVLTALAIGGAVWWAHGAMFRPGT